MDSADFHISTTSPTPPAAPAPTPPPPVPVPLPPKEPRGSRRTAAVTIVAVTLTVGLIGGILWWALSAKPPTQDSVANLQPTPTPSASATPTATPAKATTIDPTKLPIGDGKHSQTAKKGYDQTCQSNSNDPGGAFKAGPWMNQAAGTWDATQKVSVGGDVAWPARQMSITTSGSNRLITSNALPYHNTGIFPIRSSDPAYAYDRNGSSIKENSLSFTLPLNPAVQSSSSCIFGEVAILLTGSVLFGAFDAGGRDAVAWELQDKCAGHPNFMYHYHGYTSCVRDTSAATAHSDRIGYAFDGFGLFGLKGGDGVQLTSADLDECHGHSHAINWNGEAKVMYHYHMTRDFPYSISCFKGKRSVNQPLGQPQH